MTWSGRHLLDIDDLDEGSLGQILAFADRFRDETSRASDAGLRGHKVALIFAEPSTRTRLSFEVAAQDLGAQTYLLEPQSSSMVKGETLVDTVRNLDAIGFTYLVVRHHRAGAAAVAARYFGGSVVNAGDGWHAHPTQALVDLFTLMRAFGLRPDRDAFEGREALEGALRGRKVAIVGDVLHSRVARSNVWTLTRAGAEVVLCGPAPWVRGLDSLPAEVTTDLDAALRDADAVMGLRVQKERMAAGYSLGDYIERYQITERRLARVAPGARYLHPGPINEGVEVTREVARGPRSLVLEQARNGVPVRMAVLSFLAGSASASSPSSAFSYVGTRG